MRSWSSWSYRHGTLYLPSLSCVGLCPLVFVWTASGPRRRGGLCCLTTDHGGFCSFWGIQPGFLPTFQIVESLAALRML